MAEVVRYQTPVFRLSFPHLFVAQKFEGSGDPKFGCSAVWTPARFSDKEKELWKKLGVALDTESRSRFKMPFKDLPANFKRGIRDGAERADMEGYGAGTRFANLTTKMRPGVVDIGKNKIGPEHGNEDDIYPGCYCRATVTVYSYDNKGKGVALGLMNVQKVKDGERLDSRTDAAEDFDDEVDDAWLEEAEGDEEDMPY
jgi:hypothetical protein